MAGVSLTTGTETKPGVFTSEFWTMLFTNILGVIQLLGGVVDVNNKWVVLAMGIITGLYNVSRGFAKAGVKP